MDNQSQAPLPEKVVRRQAETLEALLPEIDRAVVEEDRPADTLLNQHLRTHRELGARDRRFLSQAIFSFFRWQGWTTGQLRLSPVQACLAGVLLDGVPLDDSFLHLAGRCGLPLPTDMPAEDTLAARAAWLAAWLKAEAPLKTADLVPAEFAELVDPAAIDRCIDAFQRRPPTWMRSRTDPALLVEALADRDVAASIHGRLTAAVAVDPGTSLVAALAPFAAQFVVQDIASQCVAHVASPQRGEEWWDSCAGSGGKAMHLMDLMQQEGKVLATDVRHHILRELKRRARRHGIRGIRTQLHNVAQDEPFRKTFDGVMVDAPCSGWGTWARNPDARWRSSKRDAIQCANRQLKILNNAAWCVRPGGPLVYAVCTITRPETEEVVMRFLEQNPAFRPDPFANPLTGAATAGSVQIWPWEGPGDGMFIARFVRSAE